MKSVLVIMPFFMGYQNIIYNSLIDKYEVILVDGDRYIPEIRKKYEKYRIFRHIGYHIGKAEKVLKEWLIHKGSHVLIDDNLLTNKFEFIIVINGHGISDKSYKKLKKNNKDAKFILYLWDDIANLFKKSHLEYYDEVFSYNILDCNRYNAIYLPMFVNNENSTYVNKDIDISFIASAHTDRIPFAKKLYDKYSKKYNFYFYFFDPNEEHDFFTHKEPLEYKDYIDILKRSKVTIDLPFVAQEGPTTRVCDAISTRTKVISTNERLKEYPFFSKNIYFIDREDPIIQESFMIDDYETINYKELGVKDWINKLNI